MINAASAITATLPGLPGKGASSIGGDPFTLPFGLAFDLPPSSAAPADRGALLNGTSRQVAAATGPTLPVADADAIDQALAWLPAVNIAAPPPLDIPLAVAAVATELPAQDAATPVMGSIAGFRPRGEADDAQTKRPPSPQTLRDGRAAADLPFATARRSRPAVPTAPPTASAMPGGDGAIVEPDAGRAPLVTVPSERSSESEVRAVVANFDVPVPDADPDAPAAVVDRPMFKTAPTVNQVAPTLDTVPDDIVYAERTIQAPAVEHGGDHRPAEGTVPDRRPAAADVVISEATPVMSPARAAVPSEATPVSRNVDGSPALAVRVTSEMPVSGVAITNRTKASSEALPAADLPVTAPSATPVSAASPRPIAAPSSSVPEVITTDAGKTGHPIIIPVAVAPLATDARLAADGLVVPRPVAPSDPATIPPAIVAPRAADARYVADAPVVSHPVASLDPATIPPSPAPIEDVQRPAGKQDRSVTRHPDAEIPGRDALVPAAEPRAMAAFDGVVTPDEDDDAEPDALHMEEAAEVTAVPFVPVSPLAPAQVEEPVTTVHKDAPITTADGIEVPARPSRQGVAAPADDTAARFAEPEQATSDLAPGAQQERSRPEPRDAAEADIGPHNERQPDTPTRASAATAALPEVGPEIALRPPAAEAAAKVPAAASMRAASRVTASLGLASGETVDGVRRTDVAPPVTREAPMPVATSGSPAVRDTISADAMVRTPLRETAIASAPSQPTPARDGATAAVARPAETAPVVPGTPAASPPPAALPATAPQRPAFVRQVAGAPRQTVALRPQAATQPQPAAGTTAPAAQVFGAAMHAATHADERQRGDGVEPRKLGDGLEPAAMPVAAPAELRPATTASIGTPPPLDMRQDTWPATMIDRIEQLRDAVNANDTRIRLVPDALGGIAIAVKSVGDALHVHFVADQDATRALIEDAQPRLAAVAEERGLRIGQTVVETAAAAQTRGDGSQGNGGGQQPSGQSASNQTQTPSGNGQPNAGQAQAQAGQQQSRQQQPSTARQATAPARTPSRDTDAAGDGRVA